MKTKLMFTSIFLCLCLYTINAQVNLSALFTDNMVLQQQTEAPVWGKVPAKKTVNLTTSWDNKAYSTIADEQGNWEIKISTPAAGGPYSMTVSTNKKNTITLKNILIGDVWICSGQSNMEMQVNGNGQILDYENEIRNANYPEVRLLTVDHKISPVPLTDAPVIKGGWRICSPQTVADFSAVAYFFGREINRSQNIPVGLINVSFGGTVAEAWTSEETLRLYPHFEKSLEQIKQFRTEREEQRKIYLKQLAEWEKELGQIDKGIKNRWETPAFDDSSWKTIQVPGLIENQGFENFDGLFWCRKELTIPKAWEGKKLTLNLGSIDDMDFTYFNGVQIGNIAGWNVNRNYVIPANLVKAGKAVISVRVMDTGGAGGFGGAEEDVYIGLSEKEKISLAGEWKINISLDRNEIPQAPVNINENPNLTTVLYNGMINPLVPYGIKGAIWYQGESNDYNPQLYYDIFPLMIHDWRTKWNKDFPFYYVQLANFTTLQTKPENSSWAVIRDAQLKTLRLSNTGMAVTIDIGEADDIHPRNKKDVGLRLALNARAKTYGENIAYSGPEYESYQIEGNKIKISFKHTTGGLKTKGNEKLKGFTIAGVDRKFYWADAVIEGNEIIVTCPEIAFPVAVRYAWAQNPVCNLYNGANLPASPFRTDNW